MEGRKARKWYLRGNLDIGLYLVSMNLRPVILSFLCCCCSVTKPCPTLCNPKDRKHARPICPPSSLRVWLFMEFSWSGLPFPTLVDRILSELFTMTHPPWVALHCVAHRFIELCSPFTMTRLWSLKGIFSTVNCSLLLFLSFSISEKHFCTLTHLQSNSPTYRFLVRSRHSCILC